MKMLISNLTIVFIPSQILMQRNACVHPSLFLTPATLITISVHTSYAAVAARRASTLPFPDPLYKFSPMNSFLA